MSLLVIGRRGLLKALAGGGAMLALSQIIPGTTPQAITPVSGPTSVVDTLVIPNNNTVEAWGLPLQAQSIDDHEQEFLRDLLAERGYSLHGFERKYQLSNSLRHYAYGSPGNYGGHSHSSDGTTYHLAFRYGSPLIPTASVNYLSGNMWAVQSAIKSLPKMKPLPTAEVDTARQQLTQTAAAQGHKSAEHALRRGQGQIWRGLTPEQQLNAAFFRSERLALPLTDGWLLRSMTGFVEGSGPPGNIPGEFDQYFDEERKIEAAHILMVRNARSNLPLAKEIHERFYSSLERQRHPWPHES